MNPDEWQSKEESEKEETQRRESGEVSSREREREKKQRRDKAVMQAVLITITVTSLIAIIVPAFLYVGLFVFGWALAASFITKIKSDWLRWVLHVLAPIALIFAMFWLIGLGKEAFHLFEYGSSSDY
jgi:uncharacterized membrane protein